ncbi:MAG: hypothetical protein P4M11_08010 [Candidatus Pacebacteria bacterium]|nr:hypothetical protein [Candidatus Paceibacterota bacterium]
MIKQSYADILILNALKEEQFILDGEYKNELSSAFAGNATVEDQSLEEDGFFGKQIWIKFNNGNELTIAWSTLGDGKSDDGSSMGNIYAYNACVRLAEHFCPRFILLLGIAGGSQPQFNRGDIGFGITTGYSSYCKLDGDISIIERLNIEAQNECAITTTERNMLLMLLSKLGINPEDAILKYTPRKVPLLDCSPEFACAARRVRDSFQWQSLAKKWFSSENISEFVKRKDEYKLKLDRGDTQNNFEKELPCALAAIVASGDAIIANATLQQDIRKGITYESVANTKSRIDAYMYEMESYGVGLFCKSNQINYGIIKGICDLGGEKKDDYYRLCALSSASAFAFKLVTDERFYSQFVISKHGRTFSGRTACIWPNAPDLHKKCVSFYDPSSKNFIASRRPCTDTNLVNFKDNTELPGARLFQQTESIEYSQCVANFISDRIGFEDGKKNNRLLFLFPYSVHDLLNFFRNTAALNPNELENVITLEQYAPQRQNQNQTSQNDIINYSKYLGKWAYTYHAHFNAANKMCASWIASGKKFSQIAQKMCRVICIREEDRASLAHDPRFLLHLFMCGLCIPTIIASKSTVLTYGADEATYFNFKPRNGDCGKRVATTDASNTLCLKYSDRSKLLALLGRCGNLPRPYFNIKAFELFEIIESQLEQYGEQYAPCDPTGPFEVFPLLKILNLHGVFWKTEDTLVPDYATFSKDQKHKTNKYFRRLSKREAALNICM